jgi:hypothetical protein
MFTDVLEETATCIFRANVLSYPEAGDRTLLRNVDKLFARMHGVISQKTRTIHNHRPDDFRCHIIIFFVNVCACSSASKNISTEI